MIKIKTANLIILDETKTKILLFKRSKLEDESNKWSLVGGTLMKNETFEEALKREVTEEINCDIINFYFFREYIFKKVKSKYFIGNITQEIKLNLIELSDFRWFNLDENLLDLELAFNQKKVITELLQSEI